MSKVNAMAKTKSACYRDDHMHKGQIQSYRKGGANSLAGIAMENLLASFPRRVWGHSLPKIFTFVCTLHQFW